MSIDNVLEERKKTHGDFKTHAAIAQHLKAGLYNCNNWANLSDDMKESLEMIQNKIARILNGNPEIKDHWTDIIGYATLVEKRLPNASK